MRYARRAFGDVVGFAVGWTDWLTYCAVLGYVSTTRWLENEVGLSCAAATRMLARASCAHPGSDSPSTPCAFVRRHTAETEAPSAQGAVRIIKDTCGVVFDKGCDLAFGDQAFNVRADLLADPP